MHDETFLVIEKDYASKLLMQKTSATFLKDVPPT